MGNANSLKEQTTPINETNSRNKLKDLKVVDLPSTSNKDEETRKLSKNNVLREEQRMPKSEHNIRNKSKDDKVVGLHILSNEEEEPLNLTKNNRMSSQMKRSKRRIRHDNESSRLENPISEQQSNLEDTISLRPEKRTIEQDNESTTSNSEACSRFSILKGLKHSKLMVTAIDFGTTFSGYAYCMRNDPSKIYCPPWPSSEWKTNKAPTSVLFKADKTFHSFGYQANEYYYQHLNDKDGEDLCCWYFFQNFKMILYEHKDQINCDTEIADLNSEFQGKPKMKAIDVFSAVIRYLIETQYEHAKKSLVDLQKNDIQWVLTVPAIWDLKAKQFMRESALQAKIDKDQLTLALEPEAASLYCRKLPMFVEEHSGGEKSIAALPVGSKYIVLDQGGGTIDATVHEITSDKCLKEIHQACGGKWGSNFINREFYDFLEELFGKDVIKYVEKNYPETIFDLMNRFEHKKISFDDVIEGNKEILVIPLNLIEEFKRIKGVDINEFIQKTRFAGQVIIDKDKLFIHSKLFSSFYAKTISSVIQFLERLRQKESIKDINTLLMVGGFSRCKQLFNAIQKKFPDLNIVVPFDADLAVLKGAVLYAFDPESIVCRVSQYTYGVPKLMPYKPNIYTVERKKQIIPGGRSMVDDVFDKHVEIGQVIDLGVFQPEHEYFPVLKDQTSVCFEFFASEDRNPEFVTESCIRLGVLHFDLLRRSARDGRVFLKINASGTELIAVAREESTNKEIQVYLSLI